MLTKNNINNNNSQFLAFKKTLIAITVATYLATACAPSGKVDQSDADTNLVLGLLIGQEQGRGSVRNNFVLNGDWDTFVGDNENVSGSLQVRFGTSWFSVSTVFNFSNSRKIIEFNNSQGYLINRQEFLGSGFPSSIDKGYSKIFFIKNPDKSKSYFYCEVSFDQTLEEAQNQENTADTENPTSGNSCGGFSWTRIENK